MIESLSYIFFLLSYLSTSLINPGIPELKYYSKNFNLNCMCQTTRSSLSLDWKMYWKI